MESILQWFTAGTLHFRLSAFDSTSCTMQMLIFTARPCGHMLGATDCSTGFYLLLLLLITLPPAAALLKYGDCFLFFRSRLSHRTGVWQLSEKSSPSPGYNVILSSCIFSDFCFFFEFSQYSPKFSLSLAVTPSEISFGQQCCWYGNWLDFGRQTIMTTEIMMGP